MGIVYFLVMISALVFFHELGHFLVAKAFGVKVLRFSLGFGPRIVGFERGETEYVICALPLGGYVQMLGSEMADVEAIPEAERDRTLMAKPIWQRSLVVLAGPVFNLLLPILVYFFVGMAQTTTTPALAGEVMAGMPAAEAGLKPGDRIVEIEGEEVRYWHDILDHVTDAPGQPLEFVWERDGERIKATVTPKRHTDTADALGLLQETRGQVGILALTHGATIGVDDPTSPAAAAGLQSFDHIETINGEPVERFDQIQSKVRNSQGKPLQIVALRPHKLDVDFGEFYEREVVTATVQPVERGGRWVAGLARSEMMLSEVKPGSAAAEAGLEAGDRIVSLDGEPYNSWMILISDIHHSINETLLERAPDDDSPVRVDFELTYRRDGQTHTTTLTPKITKYTGEYQNERYKREIGWATHYDPVSPEPIAFPLVDRTLFSAERGVSETWRGLSMMGRLFQRIFEGKISFSDQVGGPILIGEQAARAGEAGATRFLEMMALLSINLAVINLLPIPLLDGGQLALFGVEAIKRGPLSFRTRQITAYIGFVLIVFLMILAFKNDIERNWDRIVDFLF